VLIYPSNAGEAKGLLKSAIRGKNPVLFLEHKGLYRQVYAKSKVGGPDDCVPIGKAKIVKSGDKATIITWGAMVHKAITAANEASSILGKDVEIVDLRTISPFDQETVFNSVKKTNRVLILHEDIEFMGFGAELAAQIADSCFNFLDAPVKRHGAKFSIIPQSPVLENEILPGQESIKNALFELLEY
jgi:2-oxoisovalerate dehydrogenase E1 component